ncbi:uncharacterized protein LOC121996738 isoform X2 [Zingiber officinale]|uniref:Uncharacterized protein n=1 Tax=Zingiber officinale TaxID=94328 RepID=A0A8J5KXK3_ZINOF|nr:uncharacterized protein LOC121996738 isoform X2 [Zingiber officinale]XP_042406747.1 uncharacterized protein LOC121996738 isoform X2 [Zingiber officinale]XP_042406748.1 uncharacterized protein LOC121996738 isoform X2 [Zingiber officinale]KAG6500109.1 hypothetical protein ZIOFF_039923 [Zingiber officinale]
MELVEVNLNGPMESIVKCSFEAESSLVKNNFTCKHIQVHVNSHFGPTSENDEMKAEHLFLDPQTEIDLSEDIMLKDSANDEDCLAIEDFKFAADYIDQRIHFGNSNPDALLLQKYQFPDRLFQGLNDESFGFLNNFCRSTTPDMLLECFQMKSASPSTSCIRSARYELQAKSSEKFTDLNDISDLPNALDSLAETTPDRETIFINNATAKQFPDDFSSNFGLDIEMYYEQVLGHHPYCGSANLTEIDNFSSPFKFFSTPNDYIDEMVWIPENHFGVSSQCRSMSNGIQVAKQIEHSLGNGMERLSEAQNRDVELLIWENKENAGISNKKLRKTRRCTEQASNFKSKCYGETRGAIPKKPRSLRSPRIRPKLDEVKETMINEDKFSTSAAESKPTYESELRDDASENWNMRIRNLKCGFRRKKHNKIWTLTEVMKLIEGVSHCGVGRWIEIKKYSFPAFAFRNSIDLKDKWRNLVKASNAGLHNRSQVGGCKRQVSQTVPECLLQRVRELSVIPAKDLRVSF